MSFSSLYKNLFKVRLWCLLNGDEIESPAMRFSRLAINGGIPIRTTPWPILKRSDELTRSHLQAALESDNWSNGRQVESFERAFAEFLGCEHAILTVNATMALKLSLIAFDIGPSDEVVVPALTFPSVIMAVLECGAIPVVCDVDPNSLCMSRDTVEIAIGPRTRALIPTHLYCTQCDMPPILDLARHHGLVVIEDCAHAPGAQRCGRCTGTWGHAAIFSFNQKKPLSCGEGGCLVTNDSDHSNRVRWLRDFDTPATKAPRRMQRMGKVSEFQGAVLSGQLASLLNRLRVTEDRAELLREKLERLPGVHVLPRLVGTDLQTFYNFCFQISHMTDAITFRRALSAELGIDVGASYLPLDGNSALNCSCELQFQAQALRKTGTSCLVAHNAYQNKVMRFSGFYLYSDATGVNDIASAVDKVISHFIDKT